MRAFCFFFAGVLVAIASPASLARPATHVDYAAIGPSSFEIGDTIELTDSSRRRPIELRITAPTGEGPFPLVIMSHGLGGNLTSHQPIVNHIVSHGYLVFAPNHPASDTDRCFRGDMSAASGKDPSKNPATDPLAVLGRAPDVSFLIDQAEQWNRQRGHPLKGRIDLENIAVAGHSFGSFTVLTVCGARPLLDYLEPVVPPGKGLGPSLRDPRVDVGICYSPQGPDAGFFSEDSYGDLNCPLLMFSGSKDRQGNHAGDRPMPARNRYRAFELAPEGDKYYLWLWNAGHMGWADSSEASALAQWGEQFMAPEKEDVVRISAAMSVVFLDAYLKGDDKARSHLNEDYAKSLTGGRIRRINWAEK